MANLYDQFVGKYFALTWNSKLRWFQLKLLNFSCKNSPNNGKLGPYLQSTAAHRVHDGGIVNNAILYPSIQRSQNQVAVGRSSEEKTCSCCCFLHTRLQNNIRQPQKNGYLSTSFLLLCCAVYNVEVIQIVPKMLILSVLDISLNFIKPTHS